MKCPLVYLVAFLVSQFIWSDMWGRFPNLPGRLGKLPHKPVKLAELRH